MKKIVLIGAGGHARVLLDILQDDKNSQVCALLDTDRDKWGTTICNVPVIGDDNCLADLRRQGASHFVVGIGAPGQAARRRQLFDTAQRVGLAPASIVHPTATCFPSAMLAEGVQLLAQSAVSAGATVQTNVIVNTGAIVEHDCLLEPHVHVAPRACLAGGVRVGTGAHIGLGAAVKEDVSIGDHSIVGAGAVVIENVPANTVVVGIPAKPLRKKEAA
ncbi:MAG: acetyltransferase [Pirellulales bacterium]|nr:acetyltransferase [Pirellulales bacterium]